MQEFEVGDFGDERINRRGEDLLRGMVTTTSSCLRTIASSRSEQIAFSRLLNNERFTCEEIIRNQTDIVGSIASKHEHLLLIHDGTELCFGKVNSTRLKGVGPINNDDGLGLLVHPMLAMDAKTGSCLGLADLQIWNRPTLPLTKNMSVEEKKKRKTAYMKLPFEQRESYYWVKSAKASRENIPEHVKVTFVADRESDIYAYFDEVSSDRSFILSRACYDRRLEGGTFLYEKLAKQPLQGFREINLPAIQGKRAARKSELMIRFCAVRLCRPDKAQGPEFFDMWAVEVMETRNDSNQSLKDKDLLCWRLLTTHRINSVEDAAQMVEFYKNRWWIEQLFRTVKTEGLDVESSRLTEGESLKRLAVLALASSIKILQLVAARDGKSMQTADTVFHNDEQKVLEQLGKNHEGNTQAQKNPYNKGTLAWAAWIIARLGGWTGYRKERPPGPITMKNGLTRFYGIMAGVLLGVALKSKDVC
jgi:hypothetical protein